GAVVLPEERKVSSARHVAVRGDDRRPLLPRDAFVGSEEADRGVDVLVTGGEQRPPVLAGFRVRALRVPPEAPEGLHSARVDVLIRLHRRGPPATPLRPPRPGGPPPAAEVARVAAPPPA